ncbi:ABC transporter ATP-binding protein [Piscinibacter terrae]|nr:ATP-binding cassette domain-containing protein [Albitalea terrae]
MTELQVRDLSFSYGDRPMFDGWSAAFGSGLTWLRGGNGSGKSTLLKLLAGALRPAAGQVAVEGVVQETQPMDYRRRVFWCGPGPVAFDHLSPQEYFAFIRGLYAGWDDAAMAHHIAGFGLAPHLHSPLRTLSTGTQRKTWLTAALCAGTPVTLLDEPLNALDAASLMHLRSSLARHASEGLRVWIVATHEALGEGIAIAGHIELAA